MAFRVRQNPPHSPYLQAFLTGKFLWSREFPQALREAREFPIHTETGLNSRTSSIIFQHCYMKITPPLQLSESVDAIAGAHPDDSGCARSTIFMRINLRIY